MINAISKLKNILSLQSMQNTNSINAALPLSLSVISKIGYNRYELLMGKKKIRTKSHRLLEVGMEYWGEASSTSDSITIKNMTRKPKINHILNQSNEILENFLLHGGSWLHQRVTTGLAQAKNAQEFESYTQILLALSEGVVNIAFTKQSKPALFQMDKSFIYIITNSLSMVKFRLEDSQIKSAITPFYGVKNMLEKFEIYAEVSEKISPLWQAKNGLMDNMA